MRNIDRVGMLLVRFATRGPQPRTLNEHQQKEARRRLDAGDSARAIARDFDVHHATVLRVP